MNPSETTNGQMIIYRTGDDAVAIDVRLEEGNIWLTQAQMAQLYQRDQSVISRHISAIFKEGELDEKSNMHFLHIPNSDRPTALYNLDVIISVGYRVRSQQGTRFRIWATERLREYLVKGFTMDDRRLKELGGGGYWHELLDRIRDIRSSEKVLYRQVLDLYATSADYDPRSPLSIEFFKTVQNKLHYAAHGHTAAEVIWERADSSKPFMGLTAFTGKQPTLRDVGVAKNYLSERELKILNNLVSGYFDFAEIQAMKRTPLYMSDYVRQLDAILSSTGEQLLQGAGSVSNETALEKARSEYKKYQAQTLSEVEKAYLDTIKHTQQKIDIA